MKLTFSIDGDVRAIYGTSIREGKKAVTRAVGIAGTQLQANWRGQVAAAGLGTKLANAVRKAVYPKGGTSLRAAALVWSKTPKIIDAFERGVLIKSAHGIYLAVPTALAKSSNGGKKITPAAWEQKTGRNLQFVFLKNKPSILVDVGDLKRPTYVTKTGLHKTRQQPKRAIFNVMFTLVKQVQLPKKLSLYDAAAGAQASLASLIVSEWRDEKGGGK